MTTIAEATAAPVEVKFKDKTLLLSPMDDLLLGKFERYVQGRIVELASRTLTDLSPEERTTVIAKVISRAATIDATSPEYISAMTTVDGAAKLLQLSFLKCHPDITVNEVLGLMKDDPEALGAAMDKYDLVNRSSAPKKKRKAVRKKK